MSSTITPQKNVDLTSLNTLSVCSTAQYFLEIKSEEDFKSALLFAKANSLPLVILGEGSNVVFPETLHALVVRVLTKEKTLLEENEEEVLIRFAAGENWHSIVMWSVENGFYGIENLALIPGSIGAAPIQNIGAYGVEFESCCEYVEGINLDSVERTTLHREQCQFSYRDSIFKGPLKDRFIITHVVLRLKKTAKLTLTYPALVETLQIDKNKAVDIKSAVFSSKEIAEAVIKIRQSKLPDPADIPNVGSFFKNPVVNDEQHQKLKDQFVGIVSYPNGEAEYKLAAGWLIDNAGWKGKVVDGISMHNQQALVLTNPKGASSTLVLNFAKAVIASIESRFGVTLEVEPRVYS